MKFWSNEFFKAQYTNLSEDGIRAELIRRGATPTEALVADYQVVGTAWRR